MTRKINVRFHLFIRHSSLNKHTDSFLSELFLRHNAIFVETYFKLGRNLPEGVNVKLSTRISKYHASIPFPGEDVSKRDTFR